MPDARSGVEGERGAAGDDGGGAGAKSAEGGGMRHSREAREGSTKLCLCLSCPWKKRHCSEDCLTW